jgi:hypothetical protein
MIKSPWSITRRLVLGLWLAWLVAGVARAQAPTPLATMSIALWPEYDRPEVLVIFHGSVPEDAPLPAAVSFNLPAGVESVHAVAYLDQEQGSLVNIQPYEFVSGDQGKVLSFATPARQFQFEYYSRELLDINQAERTLSFSFTPSADIGSLTLEVQQPINTQTFTSDPPPSVTETRSDGLKYALYDFGQVSRGDARSLEATYTRTGDQLSSTALGSVSLPPPEQQPVEVGGSGATDQLGPILIAVGVLLLIAALGYWFWSQRAVVAPEPARQQPSPRPRRPAAQGRPAPRAAHPPEAEEKPATYCHRCGTKFREDALFCHACGAERRAE